MSTTATGKTETKTGRLAHHGGDCYACQKAAVGYRDRRPEGGELESGCESHADPTIKVYPACIFCDGVVRAGSVNIDREHAHASCHREDCR